MTGQAAQSDRRLRSKAGEAASSATIWIITSGVLASCFTLVAADQVTLGPNFIYGLITAWTLASIIGALAVWRLHQEKAKETAETNKWPFTRDQTILGIVVIALAIVAGYGVNIGIRELNENINEGKAQEARYSFAVTSYQYDRGDFHPEAVNQTLAELEDGFQNLKDYWFQPDHTPRIKVWLFRDLNDYQLRMNSDLATGHMWCSLEIDSVELGPIIAIPLEKPPSATDDDNFSRTPTHEMVHALMCQSVGKDAFSSIPRWFHEGMAQRFETEGLLRLGTRATERMRLWLNIQKSQDADRFCARRFSERDKADKSIFYRTSHEFIRSLESRHGLQNLNLIVEDVRTGKAFNESMKTRLGGTCTELYGQWKRSF